MGRGSGSEILYGQHTRTAPGTGDAVKSASVSTPVIIEISDVDEVIEIDVAESVNQLSDQELEDLVFWDEEQALRERVVRESTIGNQEVTEMLKRSGGEYFYLVLDDATIRAYLKEYRPELFKDFYEV